MIEIEINIPAVQLKFGGIKKGKNNGNLELENPCCTFWKLLFDQSENRLRAEYVLYV